jgi:hypothetical protein
MATRSSPPSVSRLSRQCRIFKIRQPYRSPRPVTGIALQVPSLYWLLGSAPCQATQNGGIPTSITVFTKSYTGVTLLHTVNYWVESNLSLLKVLPSTRAWYVTQRTIDTWYSSAPEPRDGRREDAHPMRTRIRGPRGATQTGQDTFEQSGEPLPFMTAVLC